MVIKRTAFATMDAFVRLNGFNLAATTEEKYQLVLKTVVGELNKSTLSEAISLLLRESDF